MKVTRWILVIIMPFWCNAKHPLKQEIVACFNAILHCNLQGVKNFVRCNPLLLDIAADTAMEIDDDEIGHMGATLLMASIYAHAHEITHYLLARGADVLIKSTRNNDTHLIIAVREYNDAAVRALLNRGVPVDEMDSKGWTALMHAVWHGNVGAVELLLTAKANPNITYPKPPLAYVNIKTTVALARYYNVYPMVKLLEKAGAK